MPANLTRRSTVPEPAPLDLPSLFDSFGIGIYCLDPDGHFTYVNPAAAKLLGWDAGSLLGGHAHDLIHHSLPDGSPVPREDCPFYRAVQEGATRRELDDVFWRRDGSALPVVYTLAPLCGVGEHMGAIVMFADESERRRDAKLLQTRSAQQATLAELGLRALGGGALEDLLRHAGAVVANTLDVEFSEVLELIDGEDGLRLVAGVGWRSGTLGTAHVGLGCDSPAGFALACDQPVVIEDRRTETRFGSPPLLRDHGVVSGAVVVVHGRDRPWGTDPWGVLGAHSRSPRTFTAEDLGFLQSVANTLALAIERGNAEREASILADERQRIMADALDAEDRTREQISQLLHDDVLQSLLAARQDLATAARSGSVRDDAVNQAREAVVEAITELRGAVAALHPVTLEKGGLGAAIKATADAYARRAGFDVTLGVDPEASGIHDQLIVSLAQELVRNAAQHSQARHVAINLRRARDQVVFEVADDGRGMDPGRPREALDGGHVGLASIAMRVEACGGRFQLDSAPGAGTRVRVALPAGPKPPSRRGSRSS
ncbi:MAG: GAF domain-containing protein [Solirubrobacteraceae bacterium]